MGHEHDTVRSRHVPESAFVPKGQLLRIIAQVLFAFPPGGKASSARSSTPSAGDIRVARVAVENADEIISAVLSGDEGLFIHKLGYVVTHCVGHRRAMELAAQRMAHLSDCELFRVHVASSVHRTRMAYELRKFITRHLPEDQPPIGCAIAAK